MIDFAFYFILILEIALLSRLEYLKWGTLVTPFNMLAILFGFVCTLSIVYSLSYPNVKDFYLPSLIVWIFLSSNVFDSCKASSSSRWYCPWEK